MPDGYTCNFDQAKDGKGIRWTAMLDLGTQHGGRQRVEYGLRIPPNADAETMLGLIKQLRQTAWQSTQLAAAGHGHLLHYIRVDRHMKRPCFGRGVTPEAMAAIVQAQKEHAERVAAEAAAAAN
jgi:hypothetical protein